MIRLKSLFVAAALSGGFLLALAHIPALSAPAHNRTVLVRSGLFDDFGVFTRPVEDGLKAKGYKVTRKPWWASDVGRYDYAVGHSMGADRVLRDNAKVIIPIDPTLLNAGCRKGKRCTNYYGPFNKFPFLICCGGYSVRGAKNVKIGFGHLSAPRLALPHILKQVR